MTFLALAYLLSFVVSWTMVFTAKESSSLAVNIGAFSMIVGVLLAVVVIL